MSIQHNNPTLNLINLDRFKSFHMKDSTLFAIFCAIGFGSPGVLLLWIIALHHSQDVFLRPGFGEYTCWFSGKIISSKKKKIKMFYLLYKQQIILLIIQDQLKRGSSSTAQLQFC